MVEKETKWSSEAPTTCVGWMIIELRKVLGELDEQESIKLYVTFLYGNVHSIPHSLKKERLIYYFIDFSQS